MASLEDVIGSYTPLVRSGSQWTGTCPIESHDGDLEVIGSRWRCACGAHQNGDDALGFLRAMRVPEPEALLSNGHLWEPRLLRPTPPPPKWGLHRIAGDERTVLITDHRAHAKAADALLSRYCVIAWPDGGDKWGGLEPLRGRTVLLWPAIEGMADMERLEAVLVDALGCTGKILTTGTNLAEWQGTADELLTWARANVRALRDPAPEVAASDLRTGKAAITTPSGAANATGGGTPPSIAPSPPPVLDPIPNAPESRQGDAEPPPLSDTDWPPGTQPKPRKRRLRVVGGGDYDEPDPDDAPLPVTLGEDHLAMSFAAQHCKDTRYVKAWDRWYLYDGDGWRPDTTEQVSRWAVELCRTAVSWADARTLTWDQKKKLARRATSSAVRDMARTDRRIAATPDQWDQDDYLVGIPGGVFDVETGKVIMGEREHYITKRTSVAPAPGTPVRWLSHLDRMMGGDATMIDFLQLFSGYCATGDVSEQVFAFLYGMGQTGKGTFLLTIGELLGDYAVFSEASTFLKRNNDKHLSELARFNGARLVIIDELPSGSVWNEERIKRVTGGGKLTVNFMHSDPFDMKIRFKLAVASNSKPSLRRVGKEMERRIRLVKCNSSIPDDEVDKQFRERMVAEEGPQILNWILQGAVNWKQSRLSYPEKIQADTTDYLHSVDLLGDWLQECTEQSGETARPEAYNNFKAWLQRQGNEHAWGPQAWWSAMEDRGYNIRRTSSARMVLGLSLKLGSSLP